MTFKLQDTVTLNHTIEKVVTSSTVKISVEVRLLKQKGYSDALLRNDILAALGAFIPSKDWAISNVRKTEDVGMERIVLDASVRAAEGENTGLAERARKAAGDNMSIDNIYVDNSIPMRTIAEAEVEMRDTLTEYAIGQCEHFSNLMKLGSMANRYRVHQISFTPAQQQHSVSNYRGSTSTRAFTASVDSSGGSDNALGNSVKYTMSATIVLARLINV